MEFRTAVAQGSHAFTPSKQQRECDERTKTGPHQRQSAVFDVPRPTIGMYEPVTCIKRPDRLSIDLGSQADWAEADFRADLRVPAKRRMGYQQSRMERTKEFLVRLQATRDSAGNAFSRQLHCCMGLCLLFRSYPKVRNPMDPGK